MKWKSKQLEAVLRESQEVILDGRIGNVPRTASERAAAKRAAEIPDGKSLKDIVSPEAYARFDALRNAYAKNDLTIDRSQPPTAAVKVNVAALRSLGFANSLKVVTNEVSRLAAKANVRVTALENTYGNYTEYLRAIDKNSMEQCLDLAGLEDDGAGIKALTNAWSTGDIDALRRLDPLYSMGQRTHHASACAISMHDSEQSANDLITVHTAKWMTAAERALATNRSTIAIVLMVELMSDDGYLSLLRSKGYEVIEPK